MGGVYLDLATYSACLILATVASYVRQMVAADVRRWVDPQIIFPSLQSGLTALALVMYLISLYHYDRVAAAAVSIGLGLSGSETMNIFKAILFKNLKDFMDRQADVKDRPGGDDKHGG